jgi:tetratricopeptide (TPR) repeat protein
MRRLLVILALLAACGGGSVTRGGKTGKPKATKLAPVKKEALSEFKAALRALKLGGPEARETARARLEAAVQIDGNLWEARHDLGVIAGDDGDDAAAIEAFGKALAINPAHTPSRIGRAEAHARAGDGGAARGDLEAALDELAEDDPLRADVAARLAGVLRGARKYDDAIDVLRDTLRVQGASSRIYTELGLIYLAQDKPDLALLVLARAAELDAKDPGVQNGLALVFLAQGKGQQAFERFDRATSLDPDYMDARFNKATVLLDAGDYSRAKAELTTVVENRPDDYAARVALGVAHRGLKDHKAAQKIWEKVVRDAPRRSFARADAMFNLAVLKENFTSDTEGAKVELERYLQDAPASHPKRAAAEEKRKELGL